MKTIIKIIRFFLEVKDKEVRDEIKLRIKSSCYPPEWKAVNQKTI